MGRGWRKWGREGRPCPRTSSNRSAGRGSASCSRGREACLARDLPGAPTSIIEWGGGGAQPKETSLPWWEGPQVLQPGGPSGTPPFRAQTPAGCLSPISRHPPPRSLRTLFADEDFPVPLSSRSPSCPAPCFVPLRDQYPHICSLVLYSPPQPPSWRPRVPACHCLTAWESRGPEIPCSLESLEGQPPNQALQLWGPRLSVSPSPAPRLRQLPIPVKPRPERKGLRLEGAPGVGGCE